MVYTRCYQPISPEQLRQNKNKKSPPIQKKSFIAEFISVKIFNFPHLNFPVKFHLSYNTAMVYTGSCQCNPLNSYNKTKLKKILIQKKSFHCLDYSIKKIQLFSCQLSWKITFVLQQGDGINWMLTVQPPKQLKQNKNKKPAAIQK